MDEPGLPLPHKRCLTKAQAADYLGIGVTLLSDLDVPSIKLGRRCVYDKLDLDNWLDDHKRGEQWRAGKDSTWPKTKDKASIGDQILGTGGLPERSRTEGAYVKALGLKTEPKRKRS